MTGISEPLPVAETFTFEDEEGRGLGDVARLDTMVTVVDAHNFKSDFLSDDSLSERGEVAGEEDERSVSICCWIRSSSPTCWCSTKPTP